MRRAPAPARWRRGPWRLQRRPRGSRWARARAWDRRSRGARRGGDARRGGCGACRPGDSAWKRGEAISFASGQELDPGDRGDGRGEHGEEAEVAVEAPALIRTDPELAPEERRGAEAGDRRQPGPAVKGVQELPLADQYGGEGPQRESAQEDTHGDRRQAHVSPGDVG